MNNYLKILLHLKQFEGDGRFHEIETLLTDVSISELKSILKELLDEGLINFIGRETLYHSFVMEKNLLTGETKTNENPFEIINKIKSNTRCQRLKPDFWKYDYQYPVRRNDKFDKQMIFEIKNLLIEKLK